MQYTSVAFTIVHVHDIATAPPAAPARYRNYSGSHGYAVIRIAILPYSAMSPCTRSYSCAIFPSQKAFSVHRIAAAGKLGCTKLYNCSSSSIRRITTCLVWSSFSSHLPSLSQCSGLIFWMVHHREKIRLSGQFLI